LLGLKKVRERTTPTAVEIDRLVATALEHRTKDKEVVEVGLALKAAAHERVGGGVVAVEFKRTLNLGDAFFSAAGKGICHA